MTDERFKFLMSEQGFDANLTKEELEQGWHFCYEFDGLLRNNNEEDKNEHGFKCSCNTI